MRKLFFFLCSCLFALVFPPLTFAFDIENYSDNYQLHIDKVIHFHTVGKNKKHFTTLTSNNFADAILEDKENRIRKEFKITPYFKDRVRFWFSIYTQHTSQFSLIHDKDNLNIVYDIMNFSELTQSPLSAILKEVLQDNFKEEKIMSLRNAYKTLLHDPTDRSEPSVKIKEVLAANHISIPLDYSRRKNLFETLAGNIRAQTGQRNMINKGILNALPFFDYIYSLFEAFKLPRELLAIPFLESSFNVNAISKVGASGIWQFMEFMGNRMLPMQKDQMDGRISPILATLGALHLLRENFSILKRWDLAVTAYNSGTKHLQLAQKKFGSTNLSLEQVLTRYVHPHLGFASKNFFSEFTALVYVLAYKDAIFLDNKISNFSQRIRAQKESNSQRHPSSAANDLGVYLTKCPLRPMDYLKGHEKEYPSLFVVNRHIMRPNAIYGRGTVIFSKRDLGKDNFYKLSLKEMRQTYPKFWPKFLNQKGISYKCSTK